MRNRAKILATITNAEATVDLRNEAGLVDFVWSFQPEATPAPGPGEPVVTQSPESLALSKALRKRGFVFVGPTTMYALMEAIGMVDAHPLGSHRRDGTDPWLA